MTDAGGPCARCGGSRAHHKDDWACWCSACLSGPSDERCATYSPAPPSKAPPSPSKPEVDREVVRVGFGHPETSHVAAAKVKPRSGLVRRDVYDEIARRGATGATDDEIETALGRSHQSVSGARNTLFNDDLIRDSGARRKTRYSNDAIAWVVTDLSEQSLAASALEDPLDLSGPAEVRWVEGGIEVVDGPVLVHVPQDGTLGVSVTLRGATVTCLPLDRADLWEELTNEFAESSEIESAVHKVYEAIHGLSRAMKKEGR